MHEAGDMGKMEEGGERREVEQVDGKHVITNVHIHLQPAHDSEYLSSYTPQNVHRRIQYKISG